jgi:hypothetical protein
MLSRIAVFCLVSLVAVSAGAEDPKPKKPPTGLVIAKPRVAPPPSAPARPKARSVEVQWGGQWWPAEVLETRAGFTKIHYTGWGPEWDEWVEQDRMRTAAPNRPVQHPKIGQRLEVEWHGSWWAAEVVQAKNGFYKIHYTGWGPEWDEWIETPRMRAPTGNVGPRGPAAPFTGRTL